MAIAMPDDLGTTLHKGLSEWWSEETEYVFQRIERWAAFTRGYNRLRSQRLSRGRMTMQEEQEPRWRISSNKLVIDNNSWSPRFHSLNKSQRRSRPEELRINCCGRFNYHSSSNLDSTCLETYRYDHSIYFKTIGDLRNSKRNLSAKQEVDRVSISSEEMVEWDVEEASEFITNQFGIELPKCNSFGSTSSSNSSNELAWPVVDFSNLEIDHTKKTPVTEITPEVILMNESNREKCFEMMRQESEEDTREMNVNNNYIEDKRQTETIVVSENDMDLTRLNNNVEDSNSIKDNSREVQGNQDATTICLGFAHSSRSLKLTNNSSLIIGNDIGWTDILLNPRDNVDPPTYSL